MPTFLIEENLKYPSTQKNNKQKRLILKNID